jgi:hypothetical protein
MVALGGSALQTRRAETRIVGLGYAGAGRAGSLPRSSETKGPFLCVHDSAYFEREKEDVVAGLESGADDYLTKLFDPEELKARLRTGRRIPDLEDRLIEARGEMRFQATHDALTSLWNRAAIMDLLGRELTRAHREGKCTAISQVTRC